MAIPGYVYALINPSMPGLVKVGRTARSPLDRASELSGVTGVPTPFVVVYHQFFSDSEDAEAHVHEMLSQNGYRVSDVREFFSADITAVINMIVACPGKSTPCDVVDGAADALLGSGNPADLLFKKAFNLQHGLEGEFQDLAEAADTYRQAAKLGSTDALLMLGDMLLDGNGIPKDVRAALGAFRQAADKGNIYGYVGMARAYMHEGHHQNFAKSWEGFFSKFDVGSHSSRVYGDDEIGALWNFFFYHSLSGWNVYSVPDVLLARRDELRAYSEQTIQRFEHSGANPRMAKRAYKLVLWLLFPEDNATASSLLSFEDLMEEYGFQRVPGHQTLFQCRQIPELKLQMLSSGWALDIGPRPVASGITPAELEKSLADFIS